MRRVNLKPALWPVLLISQLLLVACGSATATVTPPPATTAAATVTATATPVIVGTVTPAPSTAAPTTTAAANTTTAIVATTGATTTAPVTTTTSSATTTRAPTPTTSGLVSPVALPTGTVSALTVTPSAGQFINPVINADFPDPDALKVGNTYYVYATNTANTNVQAAKSTDLVHWQMLSDALPNLPAWSEKGHTWAPDVTAATGGKGYIMYFVARDTASAKQCIGVATAPAPEGPFTSSVAKPIICQLDQGGSIDPNTFFDSDGTRYLLWKNDGNCCGQDTYIYLQKVSDDGMTLQGQPIQLIHEDQSWEGNLVEAPAMLKNKNKYYLFYSANNYAGADYAIGYAMADKITGPYQKPDNGPLVKTVPAENGHLPVIGPGGEDLVTGPDGSIWMLYHSWDPTVAYRQMDIDRLTWNGDKPVLQGPNTSPEKAP